MKAAEHPIDREELMALLDGELATDRAAIVRAHLLSCGQCRALGGELDRISRDLRGWTIEAAPDSLRLEEPSETTGPTSMAWWPWRVPEWTMVSVAGTAIAGLLTVAVMTSRPGLSTRSAEADEPGVRTSLLSAPRPSPLAIAAESRQAMSKGAEATPIEAGGTGGATQGQVTPAPRIVRTANISLAVRDFDAARSAIDRIAGGAGGFIGSITVTGAPPNPRRLSASLRVPSAQLGSVLASLRTIGTVVEETQSADDVTEQVIDLDARIANGHNTERRLNDLLQRRTGQLSDVLAGEREVARVREEIERLEAQHKDIDGRVTYATIAVHVGEDKAATLHLGPQPLSTRMRDAAVDGFSLALGTAADALIFLLRAGPVLVFWAIPVGLVLYGYRRLGRRTRGSEH